jgi:hypothetical protein
MRALALGVMLAGLALAARAQGPAVTGPRFPTEKITPQELQTYASEIERIPDIQCRDIWAHQRSCSSSSLFTIWTFTEPGHPAHPAVSRGVMVMKTSDAGSTLGIERSGYYAGEYAAFDHWMKDFAAVDTKQVAEWQKALGH